MRNQGCLYGVSYQAAPVAFNRGKYSTLVDHLELEENLHLTLLLSTNLCPVTFIAQFNQSLKIKEYCTHNLKNSVSLSIKQGRERQKGSRDHTEDLQIWDLLEGSEQRGT